MKQVNEYNVNGIPSKEYFRATKNEQLFEGMSQLEKKIKNAYDEYKRFRGFLKSEKNLNH